MTSGSRDRSLVPSGLQKKDGRVLGRHALDRPGLPIDHRERRHEGRTLEDLERDASPVGTHDERDRSLEPREHLASFACRGRRHEPLPAPALRRVDEGPPIRGPDRRGERSRSVVEAGQRAVDREPVEPVRPHVHEELLPRGGPGEVEGTAGVDRGVRARGHVHQAELDVGRRRATEVDETGGRRIPGQVERRGGDGDVRGSRAVGRRGHDVGGRPVGGHAHPGDAGAVRRPRRLSNEGLVRHRIGEDDRIRSVGIERGERPALVQHRDPTGCARDAGRLRRGRRRTAGCRSRGRRSPPADARE